jgi:hypothetical protein
MKKFSLALLLLTALFGLAGGLQARGQTVYTDPADQGTQNFSGNLALTFDVNSPVTVDALGVFNALGNGVITGSIDVAIYDLATNSVVAGVTIFPGTYATHGGYDVFQALTTPVTLAAGSYEVDAVGFGSSDLNGNLNTGSTSGPILNDLGGALTFTGAAWDYSATLDHPTNCSTCMAMPTQDSQFDAGTFEATVVAEGGSSLPYLLLGGVSCFGAMFFISRNRFTNLTAA